jgi:hypothetical protein
MKTFKKYEWYLTVNNQLVTKFVFACTFGNKIPT